MSWFKARAPEKIWFKVTLFEISHEDMSLLNSVADINIYWRDVTDESSHEDMSLLNTLAFLKSP
jgi:hypothetical protein